MLGLTVLVIDRDADARAETIRLLRRAGLHAVGSHLPRDAVALLNGLRADCVLLRSGGEDASDGAALDFLDARTILVRVADEHSPAAAAAALLELLGQSGAFIAPN